MLYFCGCNCLESVPITTNVVSYMTLYDSDVPQVNGFLQILWFPPPIKLTAEILLKVALNTITLTLYCFDIHNIFV